MMRFTSTVFLLLATPGTMGFSPIATPPAQLTAMAAAVPSEQNEYKKEIGKDFRLSGMVMGSGLALAAAGPVLSAMGTGIASVGIPVAVLAGLFGMRTASVDLKIGETSFGFTGMSKKNRVIGGDNNWEFDQVVNYAFFPEGWIDQPQGPLLLYFKETQTPSHLWNQGPGALVNSEEAIAKGAVPGQMHLMPVMFDAKELQREFQKRGVPTVQKGESEELNASVIQSLQAKIQDLEANQQGMAAAAPVVPEIPTHSAPEPQAVAPVVVEEPVVVQQAVAVEEPVAVEKTVEEELAEALQALKELQGTIQGAIAEDEPQPVSHAKAADPNMSTLHIVDYPKQGSCGEMQVPKKVAFLAKMFGGEYEDGECSIDGYTVPEGTAEGTKKKDMGKPYAIYGKQ